MTRARFDSISIHFNAIVAKFRATNVKFIFDFFSQMKVKSLTRNLKQVRQKKLFDANRALRYFNYDKIEAKQRQDKNKAKMKWRSKKWFEIRNSKTSSTKSKLNIQRQDRNKMKNKSNVRKQKTKIKVKLNAQRWEIETKKRTTNINKK